MTDETTTTSGTDLLPAWAERTDEGRIRCTVCMNEAEELPVEHDCIYANDLVADGGVNMCDTDRAGQLERFAVERALYAAWTTELWIPTDPDYGYMDYFEAAATRNLSLLRGFEELADQCLRRGIIAQTDSDQAKLVTDGGQDVDATERFVTVYHQLKETEHGEPGDRVIALGEELDDRHIYDEDLGEFVPVARPIAIIDVGAQIEEGELSDWCDSHAGKAVLQQFFPDIKPSDPTLPDCEEYLEVDA